MKKLLILFLLFVFVQPETYPGVQAKPLTRIVYQSPLTVYTGKYKMTIKGQIAYIEITLTGSQLTLTSLWDNQSNKIKQLSGDNFIMPGKDWSVKFIRDQSGKIIEVVVMGTDHWIKVNS